MRPTVGRIHQGGKGLEETNKGITVSSIDREAHTIYLTVNGCRVTAICSPQNNPEIYEKVKTILIGAALHSAAESAAKFDKIREI